ncbi:MAG: hypothetical protein CHACPFDD_03423 [Phycisphaerae bacterium]|nr:hypothetical protein [Phycisphaerae bacterium]
MRFAGTTTACAVLSAALASAASGADEYDIRALPVPAGMTDVTPADISNLGQVVGYAVGTGDVAGYSFRDGQVALLATPDQHTSSWASAVNALGQIVGGTSDAGIPKSARWSSAADPDPIVLDSSGGNDANVYATAINNSGVIAGYYTGSGSGNVNSWRAVTWTPDSQGRLRQTVLTTGVDPLPPGVFHAAYGVNDLGDVAGTGAWLDPELLSSQAAIVWDVNQQPRELLPLLTVGYYPRLEAHAINNSGVAVGWLVTNDGTTRGLRWNSSGEVIDLGLPAGFTDTTAVDVNAAGVIVGSLSGPAGSVAAIHHDGAWHDLNSVALARRGWTLQRAVGINDFGQIVGTGTCSGHPAAFLLTPSEPRPHAAPATPAGPTDRHLLKP